jgi:tRNA(Ile)-lysidine synthase
MLEKLAGVFRERCHLVPGKLVVVGVSGGADSLCLFDLLAEAGYPLLVIYYNHNLREAAAGESLAVRQMTRREKVTFVPGSGDVRRYADQHSVSIEMAARLLRYRFLFAQAEAAQAQAVAVAHHADDQVETVLMHLVRGAGLDGLGGMDMVQYPNPWSEHIPLVRPLLEAWRSEIEAYCQRRGLQPLEDLTNTDIAITRNRIRHELIPFLEGYNPQIREALQRLSRIIQDEAQALQDVIETAWRKCLVQETAGALAFDDQAMGDLPVALQRQMLRLAILRARGNLADVDFALIERAVHAIRNPPAARQLHLGLGLRMVWERDQAPGRKNRRASLLWLAAWEADLPEPDFPLLQQSLPDRLVLPAPGSLIIAPGWQLVVAETSPEQAWRTAPHNPDPYQAWLDVDRIELPLSVRPRRPGERFQPLGMGGHSQKISDLMINKRLPARARERWPIVCAGGVSIWVPGLSLNHAVRLRQATQRVIHIMLKNVSLGQISSSSAAAPG